MKKQRGLRLDERRESAFRKELLERARLWIPSWSAPNAEPDFASALLHVAARFNAEVAERLDRGGDKMARGFLDWLAVRGQAAVAARVPVVFKLAEKAPAVDAPAPVRLQADAAGTAVVLETETDVRLITGELAMVVGADAAADAYYLPPPGLSSLAALEPLPTQWRVMSLAAAESTTLQLDPALGLDKEMLIEGDGKHFRIVDVRQDLVTIEPGVPPGSLFARPGGMVRKVATFAPFDGASRNRQTHELYLGHTDLLNLAAGAEIEVGGSAAFGQDIGWSYWGKAGDDASVDWQPLPAPVNGLLTKPAGALEPVAINGVESRWLRATLVKAGDGYPLRAGKLTLKINPGRIDDSTDCTGSWDKCVIDTEGMANNTPLALNDIVYPLGREPRQFDAFYLASAEAFSKSGATTRVCVDIADASFNALASVRTGPLAQLFVVGVAKDGRLHVLSVGRGGVLRADPTRPPSRPPQTGSAPGSGTGINLDPQPAYRSPLWSGTTVETAADLYVAAAAGKSIWIRSEIYSNPAESAWRKLGQDIEPDKPSDQIDGLVYLRRGGPNAGGYLLALVASKLFWCDPQSGTEWAEVTGGAPALSTVVAVDSESNDDFSTMPLALLGVDTATPPALHAIELRLKNGSELSAHGSRRLHGDLASGVFPAALRRMNDGRIAIAAVGLLVNGKTTLHTMLTNPDKWIEEDPPEQDSVEVTGTLVGTGLDAVRSLDNVIFAAGWKSASLPTGVLLWAPYDARFAQTPLVAPFDAGTVEGTPTLLNGYLAVPVSAARMAVLPTRIGTVVDADVPVRDGLVTAAPLANFGLGDYVLITMRPNANPVLCQVERAPMTLDGAQTLHLLDRRITTAQHSGRKILVYRSTQPGEEQQATVETDLTHLKLAAPIPNTPVILLIRSGPGASKPFQIHKASAPDTNNVVELDPPLSGWDPTDPPALVDYYLPEESSGSVVPVLEFDPATNGRWDVRLLRDFGLSFPGRSPSPQRGIAYTDDGVGHPVLVALERQFSPPLGAGTTEVSLVLNAALGDWSQYFGNTRSNPDLSWEYWNGSAWWKLPISVDSTQNLVQSGAIKFTIPSDLRPSDWSGKVNYWIRARLVGGDYGPASTIVTTTPGANPNEVVHAARRSLTDVHAPELTRLCVQYELNTPNDPAFVLTRDSGTLRDQSEANRAGIGVQVFTPLAAALAPVERTVAAHDECGPCGKAQVQASAPAALVVNAAKRALYLGFSGELTGQPVRILFLVDREHTHTTLGPLHVEAWNGDGFTPLVVRDDTRVLGESGLLTMSLAVPALRAGLFGGKPLSWLRLRPHRELAEQPWNPSLRGVYINAAWARAAETMTRERLGSSTGAPNQVLQLARPPLLQGSLELRVREPLSGEGLAALLAEDARNVVSDVSTDLQGHWVLWRQVADVADHGPGERVYALDEGSGAVRFGDGLYGAIPPIGRDAVVAFSYQRTEPGTDPAVVPANRIAARTVLGLVTPVSGVEAAFAADQSAGGAPPDDPERVLRFAPARLRHRGRALTLRDFEEIALQSSPDIIQARAFKASGGIRVVVAMRGAEVQPSQGARRELRRHLLDAAPAQMALPHFLSIAGPRIRRLRVALTLRAESLDLSGALSIHAQRRILAFFDPDSGGIDGAGWPMGAQPAEDDVALALFDAPGLDSIEAVGFMEVGADGLTSAWPAHLARDELALLDRDAVRIEFVNAEMEQ